MRANKIKQMWREKKTATMGWLSVGDPTEGLPVRTASSGDSPIRRPGLGAPQPILPRPRCVGLAPWRHEHRLCAGDRSWLRVATRPTVFSLRNRDAPPVSVEAPAVLAHRRASRSGIGAGPRGHAGPATQKGPRHLRQGPGLGMLTCAGLNRARSEFNCGEKVPG